MIKEIYLDILSRLEYHDWAALLAVLLMLASPFITVFYLNLIDSVKRFINKKLEPHGLRLKERG